MQAAENREHPEEWVVAAGAGPVMFKARPALEGDRRFIWVEPSNENPDLENERVMQKALAADADGYLKFGNLDRNHWTLRPPPGMPWGDAQLMAIGRPVQVITEPRIIVKGELFRGEGRAVEQANLVWDQLQLIPPPPFFPSIGGRYIDRQCTDKGCIVKALIWRNIALASEPINQTVKAVSLLPLDTFAKAITAGYGTDSAGLTGGGALRRESLQGSMVRQVQGNRGAAARLMGRLGTGSCRHTRSKGKPSHDELLAHFQECEGHDAATAEATATMLKSLAVRAIERALGHEFQPVAHAA